MHLIHESDPPMVVRTEPDGVTLIIGFVSHEQRKRLTEREAQRLHALLDSWLQWRGDMLDHVSQSEPFPPIPAFLREPESQTPEEAEAAFEHRMYGGG